MYMSESPECPCPGKEKRVPDLLEQKLETIASGHVGAGT